MEALLAVGAALAMGGSALVLLGTGEGARTAATTGVAVRAERAVARALARVSQTALVGALGRTSVGGRLGAEVASAPPLRKVAPDARCALALSLVGLVLTALLAGLALGSPVAGACAGMASVAGAVAWDASLVRRRRRELMEELPGIYRTLSVAMGSGQTLAQAVEYVGSRGQGAGARAFARMSLRLRCGVGTEEAVELLADELAAPGADMLATALVISHRTGSPLRELLLRTARLVERQGEFERLLSVRTAQVRLSIKIVCLLPVVMIALLALISPDFQRGLLTASGLTCVTLAAALDGLALLIVRRIVRGVL